MGGNVVEIEGLPLERITLFRYVTPESLEGIIDSCSFLSLEAGKALLTPGRHNTFLYILLSGKLSVHLDEAYSDPVAFFSPGDVAGELSVIDGQPTSAYVIADEPSRVLAMEQDIVWSLVSVSHPAACNLLMILSRRLRQANTVISDKMLLEHSYHRYGTLDALTGIHNRHWPNGVLPRMITRCSFTSSPLSLLMVDIDSFKAFNDTHGHLCGDQAIHSVAMTLMENLRPTEMAARYGGDEFVILLPDVAFDDAWLVAERLVRTVREKEIAMPERSPLPSVTLSVGVASLKPGGTPEDLISAADAALYRAKEQGRDTISA
jgi:diguanylate cyclase (GGDEF)-like protein